MYIKRYRMLNCLHLLGMLVHLAHADPGHAKSDRLCPKNDSLPEVVVGFDIGITHGTVSLGFRNGHFKDVVRLEAGAAYQAHILQSLQDAGLVKSNQSQSRYGSLTDVQTSNTSYLRCDWKSVGILLRLEQFGLTTASNHTEPRTSDRAQSDLEALIVGMKMKTEEFLQEQVKYLTVTTPRFLPQTHRLDIEIGWEKASLDLFSCREIEDSIVASTIATRFLQRPPPQRAGLSHAEWLLGPFRVEEIIAVLYTQRFLALSVFELYTGKETWIEEDYRDFIAVGDILKHPAVTAASLDPNFRNDVIAGMRKTAIRPTTVYDRTLRVVLQGPSSFRPEIVSLLESTFGKLLPNTSHPFAVRMILNERELQLARDRMENQLKAFTCVLVDVEGVRRVKDFEKDLIRSISNVNNSSTSAEAEFLASRGAALMSLHFLELPCEERQLSRKRPWERDNTGGSTWLYGDEDDDDLENETSSFPDISV